MQNSSPYAVSFENAGGVASVGGKNASLGELIRTLGGAGIRVPAGFATTADAYRRFVADNELDRTIDAALGDWRDGRATLADAGTRIRNAFLEARWPAEIELAIREAYMVLCARSGKENAAVAVRSSATAEDLPNASFAGQQETFLNVSGTGALLDACRRCYASLFTDRAIAYRHERGFDAARIALSIGVQQMVRSDLGSSGVMFTLDTESGFGKVVLINAAWGLGETVVQGLVDPDEYVVFKPLLDEPRFVPIIERKRGEKAVKMIFSDDADGGTHSVPTTAAEREARVLDDATILQLARWGCAIEKHYGVPMDIEWARDGESGELFIVQARPETVHTQRDALTMKSYRLRTTGQRLLEGLAIGEAAVCGPVVRVSNPREVEKFPDGAVLVAENTDPDWVPIMRKATAIVTDHGGRTSHAAIVSRELGVPALIGTGEATRVLRDGQMVTVACSEGEVGHVYDGQAEVVVEEHSLRHLPATHTRLMLNLANPDAAFRWWRLPADGVGLARMEFVISNAIKIHPMALLHPERVRDPAALAQIAQLTAGYADRAEYFVERLATGLGRLAAVVHPKPCVIRLSDFKTNEYADLIGGADFEPHEENPMLGFRGASRYYSPRYREGFALECRAIKRLREAMGFDNVIVMVPFCRTLGEADRVLEVLAENGLRRGELGLKIYVMCEIPSNVILAEKFARRFDGFSIGSNDLTQLTLGIDRDSAELASLFDESDPAVRSLIETVIERAHRAGASVGICGEAPSAHPAFAQFLVQAGIDSISVNPSSFLTVKSNIASTEVQPSGKELRHAS
ncbi:phosphoenolpyruvate synthase [Solimonas variicoloris]|uniref:phosphoenolpyruvate synthase n=1 Tax=Solimonas variicoloris TaxID=254408 RepID=UPI0004772D51|nr:phosphoenolpyruvate synthase [Solimonas variicoloris]